MPPPYPWVSGIRWGRQIIPVAMTVPQPLSLGKYTRLCTSSTCSSVILRGTGTAGSLSKPKRRILSSIRFEFKPHIRLPNRRQRLITCKDPSQRLYSRHNMTPTTTLDAHCPTSSLIVYYTHTFLSLHLITYIRICRRLIECWGPGADFPPTCHTYTHTYIYIYIYIYISI